MNLSRLISSGSLVIYVLVLLIIGVNMLYQNYYTWGFPVPRSPRLLKHKWLFKGDTSDERWKLDWGSTIFLWSVFLRNAWVLRLVLKHPDKHVDHTLTWLYLIDALSGIILFYYIHKEHKTKKEK